MKRFTVLLVLTLSLFASGCIYRHTVEPLTLDMHRTAAADYEKTGSIKLIGLPTTYGRLDLVAWGEAAIGDVAKKQGMKEIYFADLEIFSILQIWNEYTIHVYGK